MKFRFSFKHSVLILLIYFLVSLKFSSGQFNWDLEMGSSSIGSMASGPNNSIYTWKSFYYCNSSNVIYRIANTGAIIDSALVGYNASNAYSKIASSSNGNFFLLGYNNAYGSIPNYVDEYDSSLNLLFHTEIEITGYPYLDLTDIQSDNFGNLIIAGDCYAAYWNNNDECVLVKDSSFLMKVKGNSGNILWTAFNYDRRSFPRIAIDGNAIYVAYSDHNGCITSTPFDPFLRISKYTLNGNLKWNQALPLDSLVHITWAYSYPCTNGVLYVNTNSSSGLILLLLNKHNGNIIWTEYDTVSISERGKVDHSNNLVLWSLFDLRKYNLSGTKIFSHDVPYSSPNTFNGIAIRPDNDILTFGSSYFGYPYCSNNRLFLRNFSPSGNTLWTHWGPPANPASGYQVSSTFYSVDGNFYGSGNFNQYCGYPCAGGYIISFDGNAILRQAAEAEHEQGEENNVLHIYPNPANDDLQVGIFSNSNLETSIDVINMTGLIVHSESVNLISGENMIDLAVGFLPPGIYMLRVNNSAANNVAKFIKQ